MQAKIFLWCYLLDAFVELLSPFIFPNTPQIRFVSKPLLMILLIGYVYATPLLTIKKALYFILIFAWFGDVFLLLPGDSSLNFQLGLGSFLVMQVAYIRLFIAGQRFSFRVINFRILVPVLIYIGGLLYLLLPKMPLALGIPVTIYALVLGAMFFFAFQRKQGEAYWEILFGAFFFVVSDSLLAFSKFYASFPWNSFWIMSTYMLAQLLLIRGLCKLRLSKLF